MVAGGKNSFPKQKWLFPIYQPDSRLHLESIYGCVFVGDTGSVPKNILTSYWCGYLLGGIKEVKDFLQFYYWMLKMFPGVNNTKAICFLFFFFLLGNQRRTTVATGEWKSTGLALCNERDLPLKEGGGTTTHVFGWYINAAVLEAFKHAVSGLLSHSIQEKRNTKRDSAAC